jgi:subtilisin family serine protease
MERETGPRWLWLGILLAATASCFSPDRASAPGFGTQRQSNPLFDRAGPGEQVVAVVFKDSVRAADMTFLASITSHRPRYRFHQIPAVQIVVPSAAIDALKAHATVAAVGDGFPARVSGEAVGWQFSSAPYGVSVGSVSGLGSTGAGVAIAIIDSGIECGDADFNSYNCADGIDLTGRGDPWYDSACAFIGGLCYVIQHGTGVASLIAATRNNNYGIKGIAPNATIYSVKVFDAQYNPAPTCSDLAVALDSTYTRWPNVFIINMSLGQPANTPDTTALFLA